MLDIVLDVYGDHESTSVYLPPGFGRPKIW